jgi:hypothetical protein
MPTIDGKDQYFDKHDTYEYGCLREHALPGQEWDRCYAPSEESPDDCVKDPDESESHP